MFSKFFLLSILLFLNASTIIFENSLTKEPLPSNIRKQCSYNDPSCPHHIRVSLLHQKPKLMFSIYPSDKSFSKGSPTHPRSELSIHQPVISQHITYSITWDVTITHYSNGYQFCFMQVFGEKPDIMLRWEGGQYQLWVDENKEHKYKTVLKGNISQDIGQTSTWRVTFRLSNQENGFVNVERKRSGEGDFEFMGGMKGRTSMKNGEKYYSKVGVYTIGDNIMRTDIYLNNLVISQN